MNVNHRLTDKIAGEAVIFIYVIGKLFRNVPVT